MIIQKRIFRKSLLSIVCTLFLFCATFSISFATEKTDLENELKALEAEMEMHKKNIEVKKKDGKSLERDITILDSKIKKTETEIKLRSKNIQNISYNIKDKNEKIGSLGDKIDREKVIITDVLKDIELQSKSNIVLSLLSSNSLSASVDNLYNINGLKTALLTSVEAVKQNKNTLEVIKSELEDVKVEEESLKSEQVVQKLEIEENKVEKKSILKQTKGEEKKYQELLKNTEKKAAEIRNKLFSFKDGSSVNFGDLYEYAKQSSLSSGIRTEFILAILEQESAFGTNVGQCYVKDTEGSLTSINSDVSRGKMRPDSVPHFFNITKDLGRNSYKTRVSCALSYGYGGAMGMSQFMPSTWINYVDKIKSVTGNGADPWNPKHAILGTGFLLKDNGGSSQTYEAERNSACKYYSGGSCSKSSAAAKYGNQVMSRISGIQNKIEVLKNN